MQVLVRESTAIDLFFPFDKGQIASLHHSALGPRLEKTSVVIDLFFYFDRGLVHSALGPCLMKPVWKRRLIHVVAVPGYQKKKKKTAFF